MKNATVPALTSPPDPATIAEPVLFDGAIVFPAAWSEDERLEFMALAEELTIERDALEEVRGGEQLPSAAAAMLAAKRAEVEKTRQARQAAEQAKRDEADQVLLEDKFGKGRVGRVATVSGTFFLRPMSEEESDRSEGRAQGLKRYDERVMARKQALLDCVVAVKGDPKAARARAAAHLAIYHADWIAFYIERDRLITGLKDDLEGKG